MSRIKTPGGERLVLHDVGWSSYGRLLRAFAERPRVRLTYDRGVLEIMSPLLEHDNSSWLLGRFAVVLTEELGLPVLGGGSTTFRRRRRGLEPDECFWIANEPRMRGKRRVDLRVDPPPDLAIELDVTRSSMDRMGVYGALSIPEVWRLDDPQTLSFQVLQPDGTYTAASYSLAFPMVTPADLIGFLGLRGQMDENAVVRQFRAWLRQRLPGASQSAEDSRTESC
jgi:Uma2 family endonuclease